MRFQYEPYSETEGGKVHFWCPACGEEGYVQVVPRANPGMPYWQLVSASPLTIAPSVRWFGHCHFNIVQGRVEMHTDEPCTHLNKEQQMGKKNDTEERRDEDQANAIGEGLAAGALPEAERRDGEPPIEEPPVEPEPKLDPEPTETEKKIARVVEIIDTVRKNCDPADRHLLTELKGMLFPKEPEPEQPVEG